MTTEYKESMLHSARAAALSAILILAFGCKKEEAAVDPASAPASVPATTGGPAPVSAVPNAPVMGGESLDGAGMGGVGNAAKDAARRAAGSASAPAGMGADDASGE